MLPPCELAVQQAVVYRGHFRGSVVTLDRKALGAEQHKYAARVHGGHETPLVVEPPCIALLRDTVADKRKARGAESNEFIGIDGNVSPILASEGRLRKRHTS